MMTKYTDSRVKKKRFWEFFSLIYVIQLLPRLNETTLSTKKLINDQKIVRQFGLTVGRRQTKFN
jgi:hypothetical protein